MINQIQQITQDLDGNIKKVEDAITRVDSSKNATLTSLMQNLQIEQHFEVINDFWKEAHKGVAELSNQLTKITNTVDNELSKYTEYIRIGFYAVGGFFILMTVIAFLICLHLLIRGIKMKLYARPGSVNVGEFIEFNKV